MKILINYRGQGIRLTDERREHILVRPEMIDMERFIEFALLNPEVARKSNTDNTVFLYYCYHENTKVGDKWLCVVVKQLRERRFYYHSLFNRQA
jgi:hypothetical protein